MIGQKLMQEILCLAVEQSRPDYQVMVIFYGASLSIDVNITERGEPMFNVSEAMGGLWPAAQISNTYELTRIKKFMVKNFQDYTHQAA